MRERTRTTRPVPAAPHTLVVAALAAALALGGCDGLLDVENPNQLVQDDLDKPVAAAAIVNGALSTVARGHSYLVLTSGTISDELKWVGSRDGWKEYANGNISNPANEFADLVFPFVAEGRWTADEAVRLLSGFDGNGTLANRALLARAYLYSAIARATIADLYDDFAFSDRRNAAPPVTPTRMVEVYDRAIADLDRGLAVAQAINDEELRRTILAQRARTKHAKAVWQKLRPSRAANPLVNDAGAVADAEAFLALGGPADWRLRFSYAATTVQNEYGAWVNERLEMRLGDLYVVPDATDKRMAAVRLRDPIDDVLDPVLTAIANEATTTRQFGPLTIVSAREMHLIIAEAALAAGDMAKFTQHVNAVRALNGLTPYSDQVPAQELLIHMRAVNLFLQNRRLPDMYRFGITSQEWVAGSEAGRAPTFLPIANIERISNCHILGSC